MHEEFKKEMSMWYKYKLRVIQKKNIHNTIRIEWLSAL